MATAVCFTALMGSLANTNWWRPFFFAFLPASFFLIGSLLSKMHRDHARMRRRLSQLEQRFATDKAGARAPGSGPPELAADGEEI